MLRIETLHDWIMPACIFGGFAFAGLFLKSLISRYLRSAFGVQESGVTNLLLDTLDHTIGFWLVLAGISAAAAAAPLDPKHEHIVHLLVRSGFLISATFAFMRLLSTAAMRGQWFGTNWAMSRLISNLGSLLVIAVGAMLLLSNLGISITPLLTALGVGSLAVALALQDVLGNFFAGIHLVISRTIEPGEYIKLDSGQEGTVIDVGWRATEFEDPSKNTLLIPNLKLSQAILTKYHKPRV